MEFFKLPANVTKGFILDVAMIFWDAFLSDNY